MNLIVVCLLGYVVSQLLVAFWFSRRNRNEEDFLLAGRSLGPWMGTFAVFATWFGAETCIGAAGEAYKDGLSGVVADPFAYTLGILAMGVFFAATLWKRGILTLADLFRERYGFGVERLAALIMIPSSVMWAAAQVRAFGQVLASVSEFNLVIAISIAALVVILYTGLGGMWANAVTDLVQGVLLIVGITAVFVVFLSLGGWEQIQQQPAERLNPAEGRSVWQLLNTLAVPIFSTIAAQELVSRVLPMRSAVLARRATIAAAGLYLVVGLMPVLIGLAAAAYIGADADHEQILSLFAKEHLPLPLYILFLGALVSAILSTLSGALLVAASLAAHNLAAPLIPGITETGKLRANRIGVVVFGVIAYLIALTSESVYELVQAAAALGSSGVLVMMIFALWGRHIGGAASAYAALILGTGVYLLGENVWASEHAYLDSVAAALAGYLVLSVFSRPIRNAGLRSG